MRLTRNFTLKELTKSTTAARLGISNTPSKEGILKLTLLAASLLQPIRDTVGSIRVSSGYRSSALNKAIGGSPSSQHCKYEAVDLQYVKRGVMDNLAIYIALVGLELDFDQCILEYGDSSEQQDPNNPDWVHLSWKTENNRNQILVAYKDNNNRTTYRPLKQYNSI